MSRAQSVTLLSEAERVFLRESAAWLNGMIGRHRVFAVPESGSGRPPGPHN
jgi:hypothetical protein